MAVKIAHISTHLVPAMKWKCQKGRFCSTDQYISN